MDSMSKAAKPGPGSYETNDDGFSLDRVKSIYSFGREARVFNKLSLNEQQEEIEKIRAR